MNILGLSLGFNSSAAIYSTEEGLLAAISQERLNGEKNTKQLPLEAAVECCRMAGVNEIDKIAISHYEEITDRYFERYGEFRPASSWQQVIINHLIDNDILVKNDDILRVPHHIAHGSSTFAFYGMPSPGDVIITSDGFGDGYSAMMAEAGYDHKGIMDTQKLKESIALVYQFVTGALGYKEHQHEGKITGLAAFGEPVYVEYFDAINLNDIVLTDEEEEQVKTSPIIDFGDFLKLKKAVYGLVNHWLKHGVEPKEIAASVQTWAEEKVINWIKRNSWIKPGVNCYLAGGLFANVKINQRIKDLGIFKNVYVCPAMGDEGTAVGAAIVTHEKETITKVSPNQCGTIADESEVGKWFIQYCPVTDYSMFNIDNDFDLANYIAEKLSKNKIVCLVKGKMEFGPRALCHRSILYNCDTKETNTWLNDKLGRTEFMPFAPVTREEVADDLFKNLDGGRDSAKHMTMTFDCTDEFVQNYPAACHIDNTARPQIVSQKEDPFIWSVLDIYENMTGKKALINTSFNLHNNPIIESTEVAISSWVKSDTDILVIGNTVIEKV